MISHNCKSLLAKILELISPFHEHKNIFSENGVPKEEN